MRVRRWRSRVVLAGVLIVVPTGCAGGTVSPVTIDATAPSAMSTAATTARATVTTATATTASVPTVPTVPTRTAATPSATTAATTVTTTATTTGFVATVSAIDTALADRMSSSWRPGCPIPLDDLRYLALTYRTPDGADRTGELVVAAEVADDIVSVFRRLYDADFPITSMRLVDDFGADDDASMAADNTSAFNCRPVTGGVGFSAHSFGTAIDVNPLRNPYVRGDTVLPPAGRDYLDRPDSPGVIHAGDAAVAAFADIGWSWGGDWVTPTDYQHFSLTGR